MPSKKGRIVRYRGRKLQLIDLVRKLVVEKKRPVCSADIRAYLASQDEAEVGYIQAFGQILIKASVPGPKSIPRLCPIGIHRNRTYYVAEPTEEAHWQFARFCAHEKAEHILKGGYLHCLPKPGLVISDLDMAAAFALRRIIATTVPHLENSSLQGELRMWLANGPRTPWVKPAFRQVGRKAALEILKAEVAARAPYIDSMNHNRHLARVCPTILRPGSEPVYCEEVLQCYCGTIWPLHNQNLESEVNSLLKWILVMVQVASGEI